METVSDEIILYVLHGSTVRFRDTVYIRVTKITVD